MVTVVEAAGELGLTVRGVQYRLKHGLLRGENVAGRVWLIPRAEVERAKQARPGSPISSALRENEVQRMKQTDHPRVTEPFDIEYPTVLDGPAPVRRTFKARLKRVDRPFDGPALTPDEWRAFAGEEQDGA